MVHREENYCPHCRGNSLQKNVKSNNGIQRWRCKECKRYFQRGYYYNAYNQGIKDKIVEMVLNGSGVRDTSRVLKINKNTVLAVLKKDAKN